MPDLTLVSGKQGRGEPPGLGSGSQARQPFLLAVDVLGDRATFTGEPVASGRRRERGKARRAMRLNAVP
ncbi:hypothetical protein GCM10022222_28550 [Amycolatopsis ultiminotia]|uniref:Uncharacterized protein n=1 Tax=Amycolatopsis ultiminotia TaxID=543629 RepID=A0ABP6VZ48_9PSEU